MQVLKNINTLRKNAAKSLKIMKVWPFLKIDKSSHFVKVSFGFYIKFRLIEIFEKKNYWIFDKKFQIAELINQIK